MRTKIWERSSAPMLVIIFFSALAIELTAIKTFGLVFGFELRLQGINAFFFGIAIIVSSWLFTLVAYVRALVRSETDLNDDDTTTLDPVQFNYFTGGHGTFDETAYKYIIWTLLALTVVDNEIDGRKVDWIESFHSQWAQSDLGHQYIKYNENFGRRHILVLANRLLTLGAHEIIYILEEKKPFLPSAARQLLLQLCFFLSTLEGRLSDADARFIALIGATLGVSERDMSEYFEHSLRPN